AARPPNPWWGYRARKSASRWRALRRSRTRAEPQAKEEKRTPPRGRIRYPCTASLILRDGTKMERDMPGKDAGLSPGRRPSSRVVVRVRVGEAANRNRRV